MILSASSSVGITGRWQQDPDLGGVVTGLADAPGYWILQTGNLKYKRCVAIPWPED